MPATWKESLHQLLNQRRYEVGDSPRIAVLGVGNPTRSDDAAGVLAARLLMQRELARVDHVLLIEAGQAPENRTGELRKFRPDLVLLLDAADMGDMPGVVQWIPLESIDGMSASTHSLPLSILAHYLKVELNCTVAVLGIQALSNEVGEQVSPEVSKAIYEIVEELDQVLQGTT